MPEITTARLILRPVQLSDAPFIQANFADDDILRVMRPPVPYPVYPADGAVDFIKNVVLPQHARGTHHAFIIRHKQDDVPMGSVGVKQNEHSGWELGFWLAKAFRGEKYMPEAVKGIMRWLFQNTDATQLSVFNAVSNNASSLVQQRAGCTLLGLQPAIPPYHCGDTEEQSWEMTRERFFTLHGTE